MSEASRVSGSGGYDIVRVSSWLIILAIGLCIRMSHRLIEKIDAINTRSNQRKSE